MKQELHDEAMFGEVNLDSRKIVVKVEKTDAKATKTAEQNRQRPLAHENVKHTDFVLLMLCNALMFCRNWSFSVVG